MCCSVFDAIGFVYPNYHYPLRGQGKKRKPAASPTLDESAPKGKKLKVLTHRPRYIEPAVVPEFHGEASSATELGKAAPPTQRTEEPTAMPKLPSAELAETKTDEGKVEESNIGETKVLEILSPSIEVTVPRAQKSSVATPKRRMANVLDVLEKVKTLTSTPSRRIAEASKAQTKVETKQAEIEIVVAQASTEAGPLEPGEEKLQKLKKKQQKKKPQSKFRLKRLPLLLPKF
jgi:hypothetical protein